MLRTGIIVLLVGLLCLSAEAQTNRVEIEGLVTADPLPAGVAIRYQDLQEGGQLRGHILAFIKQEAPAVVTTIMIERRAVPERAGRIATLKAYINGTADEWKEQGWKVALRPLPKPEEVDFGKPVPVDFDVTKAGEEPVFIHMEAHFEQLPYQVTTLSKDEAQLRKMMQWSKSVRLAAGATTRPAK